MLRVPCASTCRRSWFAVLRDIFSPVADGLLGLGVCRISALEAGSKAPLATTGPHPHDQRIRPWRARTPCRPHVCAPCATRGVSRVRPAACMGAMSAPDRQALKTLFETFGQSAGWRETRTTPADRRRPCALQRPDPRARGRAAHDDGCHWTHIAKSAARQPRRTQRRDRHPRRVLDLGDAQAHRV